MTIGSFNEMFLVLVPVGAGRVLYDISCIRYVSWWIGTAADMRVSTLKVPPIGQAMRKPDSGSGSAP
jgi:hypothetical protein